MTAQAAPGDGGRSRRPVALRAARRPLGELLRLALAVVDAANELAALDDLAEPLPGPGGEDLNEARLALHQALTRYNLAARARCYARCPRCRAWIPYLPGRAPSACPQCGGPV